MIDRITRSLTSFHDELRNHDLRRIGIAGKTQMRVVIRDEVTVEINDVHYQPKFSGSERFRSFSLYRWDFHGTGHMTEESFLLGEFIYPQSATFPFFLVYIVHRHGSSELIQLLVTEHDKLDIADSTGSPLELTVNRAIDEETLWSRGKVQP